MKIRAVHIAVLLTLCACRKEPDSTDKKSESTTASAAADKEVPARSAKPPEDEGIDVPTEHDFEEAVTTQITPKSDLQKELDKLEQEIGE
jgi:hypothetical protein